MKITLRGSRAFQPDKMAKIALGATTARQLDLYCVAPGQAQKAHTHDDQDKIYCARGPGPLHASAASRRRWSRARRSWRRRASSTASSNDGGARRSCVLVVVTPPPPHA